MVCSPYLTSLFSVRPLASFPVIERSTAARRLRYPVGMPVPAVRKISETIADFGAPVIGRLDADLPYEVVHSTFEIVILVWNAYVMAMPRWGQPRFLADLRRRMLEPQTPAPFVEAFHALSKRRAERFASDARAVGEWSVLQHSGQWRLRCDARVPDVAA